MKRYQHQKGKLSIISGVALLLALSMSLTAVAEVTAERAAGIKDKPEISVLQLRDTLIPPMTPPPYLDILEDMGMVVGAVGDGELSWVELKQYNMLVVLGHFWNLGDRNRDSKRIGALVDRYLESGGGVLYIGMTHMAGQHVHDEFNDWLKQYGAEFEWATIEDPKHAYQQPKTIPYDRSDILWTDNIADNPITQGVNNLFYRNRIFYSPLIRPLKVNSDWTVLVRSMPSASVVPLADAVRDSVPKKLEDEARTQEAAPLIAVRQVGKGRLAVFGAHPSFFWWDLGKKVGRQVCASRGDGDERPSDWLPLLRNLAEWLTEPARKEDFPGGATQRAQWRYRRDFGSRESIDWERPDISWKDQEIEDHQSIHSNAKTEEWHDLVAGRYTPKKLLIGCKTERSGGKGNLAEWKAAAQKAGFDGIVLREDLVGLGKEGVAQLEQDCRDVSDESFAVIPGYEALQWQGDVMMRFHASTPFPPQPWLTDDGSRVLNQLHYHLMVNPRAANFPLTLSRNKTPWWAYRAFNSLPLAVYENGKLIEDNTKQWKYYVRNMEYITPVSVHLLDDPSQVAGTVADYQQYTLVTDTAEFLDPKGRIQAQGMGFRAMNVCKSYVSNGPEIDCFMALNSFRAALGSLEVPGSYRYRVYVRVRSDTPLVSVELWGDDELLRRYRPDTTFFQTTIDELHDKERGLYLHVVDAKGREAFATGLWSRNMRMSFKWCSDHVNTLCDGRSVDDAGHPTTFPTSANVKGRWKPAQGPNVSQGEQWDWLPTGTDSGGIGPGFDSLLKLNLTDGPSPLSYQSPWARVMYEHANGNVIRTRLQAVSYADQRRFNSQTEYGKPYISAWSPYIPLEKLPDFDIDHVVTELHRDIGEVALQAHHGEIRFKKDVTFDPDNPISLELGRSDANPPLQSVLLGNTWLTLPEKFVQATLKPGDFLAFPNVWGGGAVFPLKGVFGVNVRYQKDGYRFVYGLDLRGKSFKKGDVLTYNFALARIPIDLSDRLEMVCRDTIAQMYIGGGKAPLDLTCGTITACDFYVDIQADNGVVQGNLKAEPDRVTKLFLRVKGVNPNWTAGLWRPNADVLRVVAPDREGIIWIDIDPRRHPGAFFLGNVVSCDNPDVILRVLQTTEGGFDVLINNPLDTDLQITVRGKEGGPITGFTKTVSIGAGKEIRLSAGGAK